MDEAKLMEFVGKAVTDIGALVNGSLIVIGDKLGLGPAGRDHLVQNPDVPGLQVVLQVVTSLLVAFPER